MQYFLISILVALTLWGIAFAIVSPLVKPAPGTAGLFIKTLPFQNVVASGVATINFANLLGYSVEYILLVLGGTAFTKSMITDIDIKANSKTIFKDSGSRLDLLNTYRGETADAAYLVIPFDESRARAEIKNGAAANIGAAGAVDGEKVGIIDTSFGIQSLTGQITIAGATAPTLAGYAELSRAPMQDTRFRGLISKHFNFTVSPAASGTFLFDVPYGRVKGSIIKRIGLHGSTVTGYEVKRDGITIQKVDAAADITYAQKREGRVPQTNVQMIDFIKDGNQSSALDAFAAQSMEYYMTVSGAGNVVVTVELYDPLNNN